jgi:hypothetical protein
MDIEDYEIELKVFGKCYVCFEKTTNESCCECKIKICPDCLEKIILNNGKKCTICKEKITIEIDSNNNRRNNNISYIRTYDADYICAQLIQNIICASLSLCCCIICI